MLRKVWQVIGMTFIYIYTHTNNYIYTCVCVCVSSPNDKFAFAAEVFLKAQLMSSHNTHGGRH